jgi:hypothetical protein
VRLRFALLTLLDALAAVPAGSALGVTGNPADRLADLPIDDYAYDHARDCRGRATPGALALVDWLERNAEGASWGIMRCERWGKGRASLHAEGRAVDWHLDAARAADRREARRLIDLWLATDSAGNEHALARRMGIQEIIWNCHSWWSGSDGLPVLHLLHRARKAPQARKPHRGPHGPHPRRPLPRRRPKRTSFWAR